MFIIGISGKARHGKDTCAHIVRQICLEQGFRVGKWALADPLKAAVYGAGRGEWSFEDVWITKPPDVRKKLQIMGTEQGRNVFGPSYWTLQTEAYLRLFEENFPFIAGVVISDVRFPNEVRFVNNGGIDAEARMPSYFVTEMAKRGFPDYAGTFHLTDDMLAAENEVLKQFNAEIDKNRYKGLSVYIQSDRPTLTGEAALHASETSLDDVDKNSLFHVVINNNLNVTLEGLREQLEPHVVNLLNSQH